MNALASADKNGEHQKGAAKLHRPETFLRKIYLRLIQVFIVHRS